MGIKPRKQKTKTMKIKVTNLDKLWADVVKSRDKYTCRRCGKRGEGRGMQAAHIFSRRHKTTRWDLDNGLTLCFACHRWNHENPIDYAEWLRAEIGESEVNRLNIKRHETWKKGGEYAIELYLTGLLNEITNS